jgi:two-component system NtrC family sensor kinase
MTTLDHLDTGRSIVDPSVTIPHEPGRRIAAWLPFAAAVCVPLIVLAVMGAFSFTQTRHEAELRAQRTVHALAEHALRTFRAHDLIIRAVDGHIAGWDWNAINASRELHEFFKRLIQNADDINTIFVVGPTGREGNSSLVFPLVPTNMTGRPFYEDLRKQGGLHVSEPDVGRINKQRYFSFTRRRATTDGTFDGVISVSVNPAYFETFYNTVVESPTDSVSLVRSDGLLLVRVPAVPQTGERMLPRTAGSLMAAIAENPETGTFSQRGSLDGIERIYSYRRVGDYPLYATYGLSYDIVWAAWQRNMLA